MFYIYWHIKASCNTQPSLFNYVFVQTNIGIESPLLILETGVAVQSCSDQIKIQISIFSEHISPGWLKKNGPFDEMSVFFES